MLVKANTGKTREWFWKNADEWTRGVKVSKEELPGSRHSMQIIHEPAPGIKNMFELWGPSRSLFNVCACTTKLGASNLTVPHSGLRTSLYPTEGFEPHCIPLGASNLTVPHWGLRTSVYPTAGLWSLRVWPGELTGHQARAGVLFEDCDVSGIECVCSMFTGTRFYVILRK